MIRVDCVQGSAEWRAARLGVPTASQFSRLVTPKKLEPAAGALTYARELVAEWLIGAPLDDVDSGFMQRGRGMELEAISYYEFQRELDTEVVGFVLTDDRKIGSSPDRLVGERGGLEVKVPGAAKHIEYLLLDGVPPEHMAQVQGNLFVTQRDWWDFISYCPGLPPVLHRAEVDWRYQQALATALAMLLRTVDEMKLELTEKHGCKPRPPQGTAFVPVMTAMPF